VTTGGVESKSIPRRHLIPRTARAREEKRLLR